MTKDIKTTHEYKDLFCVSPSMLSDCKTHSDLSVSQVTKARIKGVPVYPTQHTHFIRKENGIIGKKKKKKKKGYGLISVECPCVFWEFLITLLFPVRTCERENLFIELKSQRR